MHRPLQKDAEWNGDGQHRGERADMGLMLDIVRCNVQAGTRRDDGGDDYHLAPIPADLPGLNRRQEWLIHLSPDDWP